jgi:hypothetical protein
MERGKPDLCPSGNFSANLSQNNFKNYQKHFKSSNIYNKRVSLNWSIAALNKHMDRARVPYGLNESTILET